MANSIALESYTEWLVFMVNFKLGDYQGARRFDRNEGCDMVVGVGDGEEDGLNN